MALAGVLDMSIRRRGDVVELALAGDLDLATVHLLREAMTWLQTPSRRGYIGPAPGERPAAADLACFGRRVALADLLVSKLTQLFAT